MTKSDVETRRVSLAASPRDSSIAIIRLERPQQRNAIDTPTAFALREAVLRFDAAPDLRAAVLCGAGEIFCAGMDLSAFAAGDRPGLDHEEGFAHFVRLPRKKPIIAAVRGGAYAGGLEIALACDLIVAAKNALFGLPEVKRGLIAAGGGCVRLPSRLAPAIARQMILTGDPIGAERAFDLGLVNVVVDPDEVETAAETLASAIAANAPSAVAESRRVMEATMTEGEAEGWRQSVRVWSDVEKSADAREGALAFKEKRAPIWRDA